LKLNLISCYIYNMPYKDKEKRNEANRKSRKKHRAKILESQKKYREENYKPEPSKLVFAVLTPKAVIFALNSVPSA